LGFDSPRTQSFMDERNPPFFLLELAFSFCARQVTVELKVRRGTYEIWARAANRRVSRKLGEF
jgi:hypothetical protein